MKKLLLLMVGVFAVIGLAACTTQESDASSYVLVEINPQIEFILDEDDEVTSFSALNEDAEALLDESDVDFIGMDIEDAVEAWLELALEAGYLDVNEDDNIVYLTVVNNDEEREEQIRERVRERAQGYMVGHSIGGAVEASGLTQEEFLQEARDLGVNPGHLRMAYAASADDEITLEEALELNIPELMRIIHEAHGMPNHREHRRDNMPEDAPFNHMRP